MLSLFQKKYFHIINPDIYITPKINKCIKQLKKTGIKYETVCDGYIVFPANVFKPYLDLMVGLHYKNDKLEFIEIFRTKEYYCDADYNVEKSYQEISETLNALYGKAAITGCPENTIEKFEQWNLKYYGIRHYILNRFDYEEHLVIAFAN